MNRMEISSRVLQKHKRKKTHDEIEFLSPFIGCKKLFGIMPE